MFGIPNFSGDMGGDPLEDRLDVVREQENVEDEDFDINRLSDMLDDQDEDDLGVDFATTEMD